MNSNASSTDELAQLYIQVLTDLLDQHCPVVHMCRRSRPPTPWFDVLHGDVWQRQNNVSDARALT